MSEGSSTGRNTILGEYIRTIHQQFSLGEELGRKFALACALEPLADKPGCTTRLMDLSGSKRLEYFIAAAVNSGFMIPKMVQWLKNERTIAGVYKFLPGLVISSKMNRHGGKINQGILEPIVPIIAAQVLHFESVRHDPLRVLEIAGDLLKQTTPQDVESLIWSKILANKISGVEDKYPVKERTCSNVYEYYQQELADEEAAGHYTGVLHNRQFLNGFSDIGKMIVWMKDSEGELLGKTVDAYNLIRAEHQKRIGVGLAADHCAIALYIYIALIDHREAI